MLAELVRRRPGGRAAMLAPSAPESGYAARTRLAALRDDLLAEPRRAATRTRWSEPAVFFFHRQRQLELEAAWPIRNEPHPLAERIANEVARLCDSLEARQAARAVPGLREAIEAMPVAKPLADLLAVPDDENVLVLHPQRRLGFRFTVRGIATVNQFHVLMQAALDEPIPSRFIAACRDADPIIPAGVPMVASLPDQCFRPAAIQPDGSLPDAFRVCDHWLWGWEPLAAAPRVDGERVILMGEPAYPQTWEVDRRFPALAAVIDLQLALSPFQVAERLSRLAGAEVPVHRIPVRPETLAAAA